MSYGIESCINAVFGIGVPLVVSLPHFLGGDDEMRNKSVGLNPDKDKHETAITLEPVSFQAKY